MRKIWKNITYALTLAAFIVSALLLCACQKAPDAPVVVSKNDGAFEAVISSDAGTVPTDTSVAADTGDHTEARVISNEAGAVKYVIAEEELDLSLAPTSVLRVAPKSITQEDVLLAAEVLSTDAGWFEWRQTPTKSEMEEQILKWGQSLGEDSLSADYGQYLGDDEIELHRQAREKILGFYKEDYAAAPDGEEAAECQWTFYNEMHYYTDAAGANAISESNNVIIASATVHGIPYRLLASNRDKADFRIHNLHLTLDTKYALERDEVLTVLTGTGEPTQDELSAIKQQAQAIIAQMQIGQWSIDTLRTLRYYDGYTVLVSAVPVFMEAPLTGVPQLQSLKTEDSYAADYYYSQLNLQFTRTGDLIYLDYTSPLEVKDTVKEDVTLLSEQEIWTRVEQQLALSANERTTGKDVLVDEFLLGYSRIRIENDLLDYYLVPSLTVRGTVEGDDAQMYGGFGSVKATLLVINLIDGSVIDVSRGY